ncbi:hypothetical protein RI054_13g65310 [Pseudoscourfieldia marina]
MKIRVDGEGSESHSQEVVHVVPELSPASRESLATRVADAEAAEAATREELHAATLKVAELEERLASAEHAEADVRMHLTRVSNNASNFFIQILGHRPLKVVVVLMLLDVALRVVALVAVVVVIIVVTVTVTVRYHRLV